MEIMRLEDENRLLREMLVIAQADMDPLDMEEGETGEDGEKEEEEVKAGPSISRKSSLTVEELEMGAEKEALERERRDVSGLGMEVDGPSDLNAGTAIRVGGLARGSGAGSNAGAATTEGGPSGPGGLDVADVGQQGQQKDEDGEEVGGAGEFLGERLASGIADDTERQTGTRSIGTGLGGGAGVVERNHPLEVQSLGPGQGGRPIMDSGALFHSEPDVHEPVFEEDGGEQWASGMV